MDFPPEILEQIFAHIPMMELLNIHSLVCKTWHQIISRPLFLPWKKSYFRYKLEAHLDEVTNFEPPSAKKAKIENKIDYFLKSLETAEFRNDFINAENHLHPPFDEDEVKYDDFRLEVAAPWLIQFICTEFHQDDKTGQFVNIKDHKKFSWAKNWICERMPEMKDKIEIASIVVICCIANDTWDIDEIFQVLLKPSLKSCRSVVITEMMYAICTAFLAFNRQYKLPSKMHYQVFHSIAFLENEFNLTLKSEKEKAAPGQSNLTQFGFTKRSFQLTAEQARIANHNLSKDGKDVIKIVAFAGTGKTTTLIKMCQEHPHLKFLVVMYNKSVAEHAKEVFPKHNVTCATAHSLAMKNVGWQYSICDNLKAKDIIDSGLMTAHKKGIGNYLQRAAQILNTIETFMGSPDFEIEMEHVPLRWKEGNIKPEQRRIVLEDTQKIWERMTARNWPPKKDVETMKLPHDGYLKLFQLKRPNLQDHAIHDVLMIDEGQDMNPAMLDIFNHQKTNKIIVGDPNQQIYTFRGAVNALSSVDVTHTYHLTQSFRFGPNIGLVASTCLETLQKVKRQTLVGGKKQDRLLVRSQMKKNNMKDFKPIAVIGRTNVGLFKEIVKIVCEVSNPPRCAMAGKLKSYNFDHLKDFYYLYKGQRDKMQRYKGFASFGALENFAQNTLDKDFMNKIALVKVFTDRIPYLVDLINEHCKYDPKTADYVFTTTHKAKGLEWKTVLLLDDFMEIPGGVLTYLKEINSAKDYQSSDDEKNLLYVALTRAKTNLVLNFTLLNLMFTKGEMFEKVISLQEKRSQEHNVECYGCQDNIVFDDNCLGIETFLKRNKTKISQMTEYFCSVCASSQFIKGLEISSQNRAFLRYFVGVLPDKFKEALSRNEAQQFQAQVFQHHLDFDEEDLPGLDLLFDPMGNAYYEEEVSDE